MTIAVAAKRLHITRQTLTRAVRAGEVPALKTGRIYRLHWPTVMAIMTGTPVTSGDPQDVDPQGPRPHPGDR